MIIKPETVYIDKNAKIDEKAVIMPFNVILGDTEIGEGTVVYSFSHIESCKIGNNCIIGPYARLRNNSSICDDCRAGCFVEIKNSRLCNGVKAAHLAYIGDADVGENCNIGCGVVFCNYDGVNKNKTTVGNGCFIGSNVNLIAPLSVGEHSFIAAGSTVDRDVPEKAFVKGGRELTFKQNKRLKGSIKSDNKEF